MGWLFGLCLALPAARGAGTRDAARVANSSPAGGTMAAHGVRINGREAALQRVFDAHYRLALRGAKLPATASRFTVGLARGLMGKIIPKYLKAYKKTIEELGLDVEFIGVNTVGRTSKNAERIRRWITRKRGEDPDRQVLIVGHSRGPVGAARAFAEGLDPEATARPGDGRGPKPMLVAIQPAFGGSPVATFLRQNAVPRFLAHLFAKALGGTEAAIDSLVVPAAKRYWKEHPVPKRKVDVVAFSSISGHRLSLTSIPGALIRWFRRKAPAEDRFNDGLVTVASTRALGKAAHWVPIARPMDHAGTVTPLGRSGTTPLSPRTILGALTRKKPVDGDGYQPAPFVQAAIATALWAAKHPRKAKLPVRDKTLERHLTAEAQSAP